MFHSKFHSKTINAELRASLDRSLSHTAITTDALQFLVSDAQYTLKSHYHSTGPVPSCEMFNTLGTHHTNTVNKFD